MASNTILTSVNNGVRVIKFNRPEKKNGITIEMYQAVTHILNKDAMDDTIVVTILTGAGDYYSSGADFLSLSKEASDDDPFSEKIIRAKLKFLEDFVAAFINYPKLLIAVINGPAVGIAVTSAALCDIIYASDRATFQIPFVKLSICAEGCSSYILPRVLGNSKANEMLLLGHKMTAEEAYKFGFVAEVVRHDKLDELFERLGKYRSLPVNSVKISKRLIKRNVKDILCECNRRECEQLVECLMSDDFKEVLIKTFISKKQTN